VNPSALTNLDRYFGGAGGYNGRVSGSHERVLIVDDDVELCELVGEYLSSEGFDVECVHDGAEGAERATAGGFAIVVLDVMLPSLGGFDVLRRVRAASSLPVVMLTARGDDVDRIVGLELGADDYLAKPFNPRELVARIRAVLRRAGGAERQAAKVENAGVDDVELDRGARVTRVGGRRVDLTTVEFELLDLFVREAGKVLTREELVRRVLGREFSPFDRSIDTHVSNLRRKLGKREDGLDRIKSVRGAGYVFVHPTSDAGRE
jgi:two-component system, OmpR family, response regulator CpxR